MGNLDIHVLVRALGLVRRYQAKHSCLCYYAKCYASCEATVFIGRLLIIIISILIVVENLKELFIINIFVILGAFILVSSENLIMIYLGHFIAYLARLRVELLMFDSRFSHKVDVC